MTSLKVDHSIVALQDKLLVANILQFFSIDELMAVRPVCRMFRDVADRYIWNRFTSFQGASSVIPKEGSRHTTIRQALMEHIAQIPAGSTGRFAADQITDETFFRQLLGPKITITVKVNVGSHAPSRGVASLSDDAMQLQGPSGSGKAHTKFISGGSGVLVGSPNFTSTALSGKTVESIAVIHNPLVKAYFNRYFDLMRGGTRKEDDTFVRMLRAFNDSGRPVSLALAPFVSIQPWLMAQVDGYDRLIIRMFLISYLKNGRDIVAGLNTMAKRNPGMQIEAYVDEGQVNSTFSEYFDRGENRKKKDYYVWQACQYLREGTTNVKIFTQTGTNGIMHDKLILAEKDTGTVTAPRTEKRVILGSSGFSTNVMNNNNFDIMARIDNDGLYDYMMKHHKTKKMKIL